LQAMAGFDPLDPASSNAPVPNYSIAFTKPVSKLRLGIPRSPFFENLHPEVAQAINAAIEVLRKLTAQISDTTVPAAFQLVPRIIGPEAYAYHEKLLAAVNDEHEPECQAEHEQAESELTLGWGSVEQVHARSPSGPA